MLVERPNRPISLASRSGGRSSVTARNHHWIAQCYLKRFATPSLKTGTLFVFDRIADRQFKTSPRNVGAQRDFNRVDIEGHSIDALESAMSEFETHLEDAISRTSRESKFADDDARTMILNFMALLAVRNPRFREQRRQFTEELSKKTMRFVVASKERYEDQFGRAAAAGYMKRESILPYEEMKEFVERGEYDITVAREWQIIEEFQLMEPVLKTLAYRKWEFLLADDSAGTFATCDHPVMLRSAQARPGERIPLGYGMRSADVLFPITKHLFAIGRFEGQERTITASRTVVAMLNSETVYQAQRQVYAANDSFSFLDGDPPAFQRGADLRAAALN